METHTLPGDSLFDCGPGDPRHVRPPAPLPDTAQTRQDFADFQNSARALDDGIGVVLEALEKNGLSENTLVICTTDHGLPLPAMKCNLTDHGLGVMLILRGPAGDGRPGGFSGGRVVDGMVSQIDVFPTLCELLDLERPAWLQGKSMMPLVRGDAEEINDAIFAEVTHHAAYQPQRAVRTQRWKYIRQFEERGRPVMPNVDDSPSKTLWVQHGWRERPVAAEQLYDLIFDPGEVCNVADDPALSGVRDALRARLDQWMRDTGDPILRGPVPVPPGTATKDPDDLSPKRSGHD